MTAIVDQKTGELIAHQESPSLEAFASSSPTVTLKRGREIATAAKPVIEDLQLVKRIGQSNHCYFDAWTMVGAMAGVYPVATRTWEIGNGEGYGANVEARSLSGIVVGAADAVVMRDEEVGGKQKWLTAPAFQIVSMAQTRAGGKALRMPLGWIMRLAGYEATPAEEMDERAVARGEAVSGGRGVKVGWKDIGEQQRWHADLGAFIDQYDLRQWVASFIDSKGYGPRPLPKAQFMDLKRAIEREVNARTKTSGPGVAQAPPGETGSDTDASVTGPGPTQDPPNAEAPTSPPPASPRDGDGKPGRRRRDSGGVA